MSTTDTMKKAINELQKAKEDARKRVEQAVQKVKTADKTQTE